MMALIPFLAITLVFLMKNSLKISAVAPAQDTAPPPTPAVATSDVDITWEIPPLYPADSRDPMQLPTPSAALATVEASATRPVQTRVGLVVTGILYSDDRPTAIVNTQLVREGQQISGAVVRNINIDGVEFEMNGRTWKQAVDK